MCVSGRERKRECECVGESVCVGERERESVSVCERVCVCLRESVCVSALERERERERDGINLFLQCIISQINGFVGKAR